MFWTSKDQYLNDPFETQSQLECAIAEVSATLFGPSRIYLEVKNLRGQGQDEQNRRQLRPDAGGNQNRGEALH
jgi:hypothetical protein